MTTSNSEDSTPEDVVDRIMADPAMSPRVVALIQFGTGSVPSRACSRLFMYWLQPYSVWPIRNLPGVRHFGCTVEAVWKNVMISMRFDYVI